MCCYVRESGGEKKNATYMSHICMKKESSAELKERGSLFGWLVGVCACDNSSSSRTSRSWLGRW